ncbi:multiple sugar transport system permease protein [Paenibacillus sp. yr247]|uniref:carbohydrate ABC transporter permease n=1 Tax=Paenibacillus sp. yr247 TaxID=1761880 RepID=UPI000883F10C|nr:carbohydrate ABC transporter permease [Paenibacillus sp. yr247]SDN95227.1 multiple sugar transport system permease protein [Paenibacillus sp. yr247]
MAAAITSRRKPINVTQLLTSTVTYAILIIVSLSMLYPFIWMFTTSLKQEYSVFEFPPRFIPETWEWVNYATIFKAAPFLTFLKNTVFVTMMVVIGQLLVCSLAAYAFARLSFKGRDIIFIIFLSTMMIPAEVTLIPTYVMVYKFGWLDKYAALIVPGLSSAYGIFMLKQFFLGLPKETEDAARIDGCSELRIYWNIILPLSKPALATLAVFTFMGIWTDFLWPLLVTNTSEMRTLEVGLSIFRNVYTTNWPLQMGASLLVIMPVLIVYIFSQKYFVQGISLTGMKG